MFAAHFAAGLAIGARTRQAPTLAILVAAFLPDLAWIGFSYSGLEPSGSSAFFDDWSHSLLSILFEATCFAFFFAGKGIRVWLPIWLAGISHVVLDAPIHPKPIALYPHASLRVPWDLWQWGSLPAGLAFSRYWWLQFAVVAILLGAYTFFATRSSLRANLVSASVLIVLGLHLLL